MPKPLRLFIRPPYTDWTLVHGFGHSQPPPPPPAQPTIHTFALLRTTGAGELFAAVEGKLSARPPGIGVPDPTLALTIPAAGAPLPATVNLYLHISPTVAGRTDFDGRAAGINRIFAFAYLNVETASLEGALAELLDAATIPPGGLTRSQIVDMLVRGRLDVRVTAGHAVGAASTQGAPAGSRQIGFTVLTLFGPLDPAHSYDWMRDFVEDGQPDIDTLLALMPKRWPVIDAALGTNEAINLTQFALYPMTVLQDLNTSRNLSRSQFRQVGNNQKALWRRRLLRRVGHAPAGSTDPPFEFDDRDWRNIFQLEAVVEFFANFDDPWASGAVPRNPGDPHYNTLDFLDPAGTAATVAGNVATLDGNPDLTGVTVNHDVIVLDSDTARASRTYRITAVDDATNTVTLDAAPALTGASSTWRIRLRPVIVIIDPFGGRLGGDRATAAANVVTLDDPVPDLSKVNPNFDTIYLPSDTARPSRTYRIINANDAAHTVTLDANPNLDGGASAWSIQAGIGGELPALAYNLGPGGGRGYDHFDGITFIAKNGELQGRFRWTSYTSRNYPAGSQLLSSLRGNQLYDVSSYWSGKAFRNYSFKVTDRGAAYDGVREARFYFSTPVTPDNAPAGQDPNGGGKTLIRLHYSRFNNPGGGASSAGCLVSPMFEGFRTRMIELYQDDFRAVNGANDPEVQKLRGRNHAQSETLWNNTQNGVGGAANQLTAGNWNDRLRSSLWVIRPDERPLP